MYLFNYLLQHTCLCPCPSTFVPAVPLFPSFQSPLHHSYMQYLSSFPSSTPFRHSYQKYLTSLLSTTSLPHSYLQYLTSLLSSASLPHSYHSTSLPFLPRLLFVTNTYLFLISLIFKLLFLIYPIYFLYTCPSGLL